jgi:sugar O-acyltransferase (sialic acid O-acetyltransferase NeuD family)
VELIVVAGSTGQHAVVVYEAARLSEVTVAGCANISDGSPGWILDCEPLGMLDEIVTREIEKGTQFIVACGSNGLRREVTESLRMRGASLQSVFHPAAIVSPSSKIKPGSALLAGAIVGPRAVLGHGVIINHGATVDHDCIVEDYVNISPGARLGGCVRVRAGAFIGMNASIIQGLEIGADAIVGAGAVVTRDVQPGTTVFGVPARTV